MAQTIVGEAGGRYQHNDWKAGQEAVVWTIINRYLDSYHPDDWGLVVTQKGQYTGYESGKAKYEAGVIDSITWDYAYTIARYAVTGQFDRIPYPEGFTNEHKFFRSGTTPPKSNWCDLVYAGGNCFFRYENR